jgi:AraC-like DNA-binding protein
MHDPYFFTGRERELRNLINNPANDDLDQAACVGVDPDVYHPDDGQPDELSLFRCNGCPARLACLALALRAEEADGREGWYGGLGPVDRDAIASILRLETPQPQPPDRAVEAAGLRASGWAVNQIAAQLGCSRRTVQRYLQVAA